MIEQSASGGLRRETRDFAILGAVRAFAEPLHVWGRPCAVDELTPLAERHDLALPTGTAIEPATVAVVAELIARALADAPRLRRRLQSPAPLDPDPSTAGTG